MGKEASKNARVFTEEIERLIVESTKVFYEQDGSVDCPESAALELLSMGELIDRLTIVNCKMYTLKNEVVKNSTDYDFCVKAALEDIKLVTERARLKKCIDEKLIYYIKNSDSFNPETKLYGVTK